MTRSPHSPAFTATRYPPSWVDQLTERVGRLPGPSWVYYLTLWIILFATMTLIQWSQGGYPPYTFNRYHLVITGSGPLLLMLVRYLNRTAAAALSHARPLLNVDEAIFQLLGYRLTTLPARAALGASVLPLLLIIPNLRDPASIFYESQVALTPLSMIVTVLLSIILSCCSGVVLYKMYRQMRLVNFIYSEYARVDLFRLSPLYGFSRLTAQAAIGLLLIALAFYIASPSLIDDPANVLTGIFGILICLAVFVLPLVGVHNRIVAEKERVLGETTGRTEFAMAALHRAVDGERWQDVAAIKEALTGLDVAQRSLERIPTWPWQPETPRLLVTALLIPIVLVIIQIVVQQLLAR